MKKWLWLALLGCNAAQADMLDALQAYEQKNYPQAQQEFAKLLPLGNELAAFNLGAMAYQGEGQPADLVKAMSHFMLAAELQHAQAKDVLTSLVAKANALELEQANQRFEQLKQNIVIMPVDLDKPRNVNAAQPIKRVPPVYPKEAVRNGLFGYVALRFLVDEQGQVSAVDTLDAFPEKTFEKASVQAIKKWRYEATGKKHLLNVRLDYSISGGVKISAVENVVDENKLWLYASAGSPQHQLALGTLLSLISIQSGNRYWHDPALPLDSIADFSIFEARRTLRPGFSGFWGNVLVRVDAEGTILEQLEAEFEQQSEISSLIGLSLKGKVETDVYRVVRQSLNGMKEVSVVPSLQVSRAMSGMFWWEQAAKNGNVEAQRIMAAYDKQWEDYLLNENDAEVMAWTGTRLILEGQREQGLQLLQQAIAKNYQPATELKKQFM